jgi:Fe-S oxidoreductase/FAD/FMN-containing dehydrogenase
MLNQIEKQYLSQKFGARVNFRPGERKLYGHDVAALPALIKPLVGNALPDGVVQPESEAELIDLVNWAVRNRVALTPRGKATTGYGGVLPLKHGIVVDFYRLNKILKIDSSAQIAVVQPGAIFEKLDRELKKQGLTLRSYPSSYPAATIGGWLAQGGAGIGSFETGWFKDNVASARIVTANGQALTMSGNDLDLVSEAGGTTGLISEITLKVMPDSELAVMAIGSPDGAALQAFIEKTIEIGLPVWSVLFINPRMAEFRNIAPVMEHMGHPVEAKVLMPKMYITTVAVRKNDLPAVQSALPAVLKFSRSQLLAQNIADHEWENRFRIMIIKRLGPSLVPAEVVVPLNNLGNFIADLEKLVNQPLVKEGIAIRRGVNGQPEVVILGFIPADQRKFTYNFVFGLSLTIMSIAEKHGGRAYTTGLYYASKVVSVLGRERVAKLAAFKKQSDPASILNPGKVIAKSRINTFMGLASKMEPLIRPFGNKVITQIGERPVKVVKDIPPDVAWYAYACSQCGYCVDECDQFYGRGWESQSPRGKWYWLREYMEGREEWDQFMVDTMLVCTTCELCNHRCSASLPIEPSWMKLRGKLIHEEKRMTFPPFEIMCAALQKEGDIWAGYRQDRTTWFPQDLWQKHGTEHKAPAVYFAGCTASYVEADIGIASVRLLDAAGVDFSYLGKKENCCGTPMLVAGKWEVFAETMRKNIAAVKASGADTVISSCPACNMMWRHVYPQWAKQMGIDYNIKALHYSEVLAQKIAAGEFKFTTGKTPEETVTWHDSCHIGRVSGVYEPPRDLIKAIPNVKLVEMEHNRDKAHCCGSVLTLIKDPTVAALIGDTRLKEAENAGAEKVLALCPCCEFQLRVSAQKTNSPVEVVDLARFAASALGYNFPDPNPEVQRQWAVFEAMIALMTPSGFAGLMGQMWPELIAAMPLGMGKMMRVMGKVPGALSLMKPLFPLLFPRLLPAMMPKVMPKMLDLVGEKVPMPDYMRQQMPELMPKVMDNLMPHMITDLVPLVTQPMIDYLRHPNSKK